MKKFIFLLSIPLVLAGCTTARTEIPTETPKPVIEKPMEASKQPTVKTDPMANMPCHEMPDGSLMGDCPTDSNGELYLPDTAPSANETMKGMDDMPCHKMPDGSLMGDCPVDEFGNPYIPTQQNDDHVDDPNEPPHEHDESSEDDHEHAPDVAPHRH